MVAAAPPFAHRSPWRAAPLILVSIGAFSAVCGGFLAIGAHGVTWFQTISVPYVLVGPWFLSALVLYYLVWKYVVGFLNQVLGIA